MIHITQVMIADGDTEFTHLLCRALRAAEGFAVSGIYQTATGLENIVRETNPVSTTACRARISVARTLRSPM